MTCSACVHFPRCVWLVGAQPSWTECDWIPSRFAARTIDAQPEPDPQTRRRGSKPEATGK